MRLGKFYERVCYGLQFSHYTASGRNHSDEESISIRRDGRVPDSGILKELITSITSTVYDSTYRLYGVRTGTGLGRTNACSGRFVGQIRVCLQSTTSSGDISLY